VRFCTVVPEDSDSAGERYVPRSLQPVEGLSPRSVGVLIHTLSRSGRKFSQFRPLLWPSGSRWDSESDTVAIVPPTAFEPAINRALNN
jgi:hypothetical protein